MSALANFASYFGQLAALFGEVIGSIVRRRLRWRLVSAQIYEIGVGSQLVVLVTGAFTGAVFAAQIYFKFSELGLGSATGPVVSIAMCRELGPVLAALMVAGRMGAAMSAEIGTMKVTEQVDALRSMGVHPVDYLVVPRVLAMMISMPILVGESIFIGIAAAQVLTVYAFDVPEPWFREQLLIHTDAGDIFTGLIKAFFFGLLIVVISCHQGLKTRDGAVGVGRATTSAVVYASLAILIVNLFLTLILNHWFPLVSISF